MPVLLTELFASILTPKGESSAARLHLDQDMLQA